MTPRQIAAPAFKGYLEVRSEDGGLPYYFDRDGYVRSGLSPSDPGFTGLGYEIASIAEAAWDHEDDDEALSQFWHDLNYHLKQEYDAVFRYEYEPEPSTDTT